MLYCQPRSLLKGHTTEKSPTQLLCPLLNPGNLCALLWKPELAQENPLSRIVQTSDRLGYSELGARHLRWLNSFFDESRAHAEIGLSRDQGVRHEPRERFPRYADKRNHSSTVEPAMALPNGHGETCSHQPCDSQFSSSYRVKTNWKKVDPGEAEGLIFPCLPIIYFCFFSTYIRIRLCGCGNQAFPNSSAISILKQSPASGSLRCDPFPISTFSFKNYR